MSPVKWYLIEDVNPQPWAIGPLGVGRRNGGNYPYVAPNKQLTIFQNAVREQLSDFEELPFDGHIELSFYLWRRIETHRATGRKTSGHQSDATNMQKALEDALQGVLFPNDRAVQCIRTAVVEQSQTTRPRIVIRASQWEGLNPDELPDFIWQEIDRQPVFTSQDNTWGGDLIQGVF
jgi:Holliday junction resolvase RusA-like endonuclease